MVIVVPGGAVQELLAGWGGAAWGAGVGSQRLAAGQRLRPIALRQGVRGRGE